MTDNIIPFQPSNEPSIEKVEELCIAYLQQAQNPLVPVETLLQRCQREGGLNELTEEILVQFLSKHALIDLLEGPTPEEIISQGIFEEAGFQMGKRAILKERIPNENEMKIMMVEQLKVMLDTLNKAIGEAENDGDQQRKQQLEAALTKAKDLQLNMQSFFEKA